MEEESMKRNMTISRKIAVGALSVVVGCSAATVNLLCASTAYAETEVKFNDESNISWVVSPVPDDNYTGEMYMYIDAVEEGAKVKKLKLAAAEWPFPMDCGQAAQ